MEQQRGSEGGRLVGRAVKKGPGASPEQPSLGLWPFQLGSPGTSLRLPVGLREWMDGVRRETDAARGLVDTRAQNTSAASGLAAEQGG